MMRYVSILVVLAVLVACGPLNSSSSSPGEDGVGARVPGPAARPGPSAPTPSASGGYTVTFGVGNRVGRLGAVQFEASAKSGADWQGSAASVSCRNASGAAMMACNDKGGGKLSCAFVDAKGIGTPIALVSCRLSSSKPVAPSDFAIKVVDASSPDMKPAKASVVVSSVSAN